MRVMRDLFNRIAETGCSKLGAVLHLGAGMCRELEDFLRLKPDKIILVEANPKLTDELRSKARSLHTVEVVGTAVAATGGQALLWVLNNARESSVHRPTQLLKRYPNLGVTKSVSVPAMTVSQLVDRLSPEGSRENLLVLELQGAELAVLSSAPLETLQKFSWIATRTSTEALYEGGARFAEVDALLRRSGFRPVAPEKLVTELSFHEVLYRRDAAEVELGRLRTELDRQRRLAAEQADELRRLTRALEEQGRLQMDRQTQIEQLNKERDETAKQTGERQARIDQLTKEREATAKQAGERQARIDQLTRERDEQTKLLTAAQQKVTQLEQQQSELEHRQRLLDEEMVKAEAQIELIKDVLLREKGI